MARLVDHGAQHALDGTHEGDGPVVLKRPAVVGRDVDDVSDPFAHLDGDLAELAGHGVDGCVGFAVVAEDPRVAALPLSVSEGERR